MNAYHYRLSGATRPAEDASGFYDAALVVEGIVFRGRSRIRSRALAFAFEEAARRLHLLAAVTTNDDPNPLSEEK